MIGKCSSFPEEAHSPFRIAFGLDHLQESHLPIELTPSSPGMTLATSRERLDACPALGPFCVVDPDFLIACHAVQIAYSGVTVPRVGMDAVDRTPSADIPHIPSKFVEIVPLSHRQGNCIPYAAIRWHDFGNRPALGRPLGHFSRHPDTPLLSLSPRRRFPRPTPERVFVADHQSSSGFSGTGPSAPPPQPIGT